MLFNCMLTSLILDDCDLRRLFPLILVAEHVIMMIDLVFVSTALALRDETDVMARSKVPLPLLRSSLCRPLCLALPYGLHPMRQSTLLVGCSHGNGEWDWMGWLSR